MKKNRLSRHSYLILIFLWGGICLWQYYEHREVVEFARSELRNKAKDISEAVSVVIRSQRAGGSEPEQERLNRALQELVSSTDLESVMLLNSSGQVKAMLGAPLKVNMNKLAGKHEYWGNDFVTFTNLVALGDSYQDNAGIDSVASPPPHAPRRNQLRNFRRIQQHILRDDGQEKIIALMDGKALDEERLNTFFSAFKPGVINEKEKQRLKRLLIGTPLTIQTTSGVMQLLNMADQRKNERLHQMSRKKISELIKLRGIHSFIVTLPIASVKEASRKDINVRIIVILIALAACGALAAALRITEKSFALQLRLVHAQDTAEYLKDQNMAAAGLVHETKNPLNIIRGLAQMIQRGASDGDTAGTAVQIIEEVDRVTGRLNQFLDYSKPRQPSLSPVKLEDVVEDVFRLLEHDSGEKNAEMMFSGSELIASADREMLRQLLFNLILNALDVVDGGGVIRVVLAQNPDHTLTLDVCDTGPGVPPELREEIFRPYYTTRAQGTGLGLTVVRQIVTAHEWNIEVLDSGTGENIFRITGIKQQGS
jgi:signal transduction histidine kinase